MSMINSFYNRHKNFFTAIFLVVILAIRYFSINASAVFESYFYIGLFLLFIVHHMLSTQLVQKFKFDFLGLLFAFLLSGCYIYTAYLNEQKSSLFSAPSDILIFLALLIFFYLFFISTKEFWFSSWKLPTASAFSYKHLFFPVIAFTLSLAVQYLWFFPAKTSPDTVNQWQQIHGILDYNTIHSIGHTIFLKALLSLHDNYAIVVITQLAGIILVYTQFFCYFAKKGFPAHILIPIFSIALIFSALAGEFAYFAPWKDTPAALCLSVITLIILKYNDSERMSCWAAAVLGLALAWCWLFRLNGIIAFVTCGLYFIISFIRRKYYRQLSAMLMAVVISISFVNVYSALVLKPVEHNNGFSIQVFGSGIAAMVNSGELTEAELEEVDNLLSVEWMQKYYRRHNKQLLIWFNDNSDAINSDPNMQIFNNQFVLDLGENKKDVILLYLKLMPKHLSSCIMDVVGSLNMMWKMSLRFLERYIFLFSLMVFLAIRAKLKLKDLLVFMPSVCNTVSIMISTITNETRYLLPAFMLMPVFFLYIIWKNSIKNLSTE